MGANSTNAVNDGNWLSHPWQGYGARFPTWRSEFTRVTQGGQVEGERIKNHADDRITTDYERDRVLDGTYTAFSVSVNA